MQPMDLLNAGNALIKKGFAVFIVAPDSKIPLKSSNGWKDATKDPVVFERMVDMTANGNLAIATGRISNIFVVDVDNKPGVYGSDTLRDLEMEFGRLPHTPHQITPNRGTHFFFRYPNGIIINNSVSKLGDGLDIRGDGGYIVVSPSVIDGKAYEWEISSHPDDIEIADAPDWLLKKLGQPKRNYDINLCGKDLNIKEGNRNERIFEIGIVARNNGLKTAPSLYTFLHTANINNCKPPLPDHEVMSIVESILSYQEEMAIKEISGGILIWDKDKNGKLRPTYRNTENFFKSDEKLKLLFKHNEFSKKIELTRSPFWTADWQKGNTLDDQSMIQIKSYLASKDCEPPVQIIHEVIKKISYDNRYHPVRDYLNPLKWDGVSRLESFFPKYFGTKDTPYTQYLGKLLICSMVERIYNPGCKYDYMIILEGEQGIRKSMALKALGGDWFGEVSLTERDKDTIDKMQGLWIIEVAELVVFRKKEVEELKSFISTQVDRARLAYGHTTQDFRRQCVLVGSINPTEEGYLSDITGNRRFLPIRCSKINLEEIIRFRDQNFAEAKVLLENGFKLYLPPDLDKSASQEQEARMITDSWEDPIQDWLKDPSRCPNPYKFRSIELWKYAFQGEAKNFGRTEQRRIASSLKKLGYVSRNFTVCGECKKYWFLEKLDDCKQETAPTQQWSE